MQSGCCLCCWRSLSQTHALTCSQRPSECPPQIYPAAHTVLVLSNWSAHLPLQGNREKRLMSEWTSPVVLQWQTAQTDRWHAAWHQCVWRKEASSQDLSFSCHFHRQREDTHSLFVRPNNLYCFPRSLNTQQAATLLWVNAGQPRAWNVSFILLPMLNPASLANARGGRGLYATAY